MTAAGPSIAELLNVIRQQNEALVASNTAMQQMRQEQQDRKAASQPEAAQVTGLRNAFLDQVAAVEANNSMHGCKGDRPLEQEEIDFRNLVQALGVNWVTAEELFRQGISSMDNLESVDADKLKTTFTMPERTMVHHAHIPRNCS